MKTKSCKAKGRVLQNMVRDRLMQILELSKSEIRCAIMGETGKDIIFTNPVKYPYFIECKNRQSVSVYKEFQSAKDRAGKELVPILVIKKNGIKNPLAVVELGTLADLIFYCTEWRNKR